MPDSNDQIPWGKQEAVGVHRRDEPIHALVIVADRDAFVDLQWNGIKGHAMLWSEAQGVIMSGAPPRILCTNTPWGAPTLSSECVRIPCVEETAIECIPGRAQRHEMGSISAGEDGDTSWRLWAWGGSHDVARVNRAARPKS